METMSFTKNILRALLDYAPLDVLLDAQPVEAIVGRSRFWILFIPPNWSFSPVEAHLLMEMRFFDGRAVEGRYRM